MARRERVFEPNGVYHAYNRRTDRQLLFPSPCALDNFLGLMEEGCRRYDVRICAYCLMDTHWHQAIWVREGDGATAVIRYLQRLSSTHAIRFRLATDTRGLGHVYQDRYKANRVDTETGFYRLVRYIEANPLTARLVDRAEYWPWSSLAERLSGQRRIVAAEQPIPLPSDWTEIVNAYVPETQFDSIEPADVWAFG
ncbi:MAG TPA: transposase [Vicinamibacterales bacterium]|jgi:putative transposase